MNIDGVHIIAMMLREGGRGPRLNVFEAELQDAKKLRSSAVKIKHSLLLMKKPRSD